MMRACIQRPYPHTTTQRLRTPNLHHQRPDAFYRLYTAWHPDKANAFLLRHLLPALPPDKPLVLALDGTYLPRTGQRIPDAYWLRNPQGAPFDAGLRWGQRFETGIVLLPSERGSTQALPLCFMPAFSSHAKRGLVSDRRGEVSAGLAIVEWVCSQCAALGSKTRKIVVVGDGAYDTRKFGGGLPEGVLGCTRVNAQACLCALPPSGSHRGQLYSSQIIRPWQVWQSRRGWERVQICKNGRVHQRQVKVVRPLRRVGWGARVFYLIVVRGRCQRGRVKRRDAVGLLVSTVWDGSDWVLPYSVSFWLECSWGRWEVERTHRVLKRQVWSG